MSTVTYRLKEGKKEWSSIYVRFKQGNVFDTEVSTGLECPQNRWSKAKKEVLSTEEISYVDVNAKLANLKLYIRNQYESIKTEDKTIVINNKWLKLQVDIFFKRKNLPVEETQKIFITDFMESFIKLSKTKNRKNAGPVQPRTIQHYQTTKTKIENFEKSGETEIKLKLSEINLKFHREFIYYLENTDKLNNNTIGGYIDVIKLICKNAKKKGYTISEEVNDEDFYTPSNKTNDIYLKEHEINLIYNHQFDSDYLDNTRDWFIIGLRTGLRISDFLQLSNENISDGFIFKTTLKTDYPVIIPIHDQVESILQKRNGQFPRKITDQKFNSYIKTVAEKAGITENVNGARMDKIEHIENGKKKMISRKQNGRYPKFELVSSHICRRSFASNLYGKLDTLTIMKITGHSTEKQFLAYIKITPKEYAEKLKALWEKQKLS